ncbi:MAG: AsmA-like C-terminal region-containing protein [Gemmatimonadota bacterium]
MRSTPTGAPLRGRRLFVWVIAAAGAAVLGYAGLGLLLRSALDPASLAAWLEPRLSAALNRNVELRGVRVAIFPRLSVQLSGVRVENLGDFGHLPLATVRHVRLSPRLLPLLRREVRIGRILIEEPRVLLQVARDGRSNFGDFVPEGEGVTDSPRRPVLSFDVQKIAISRGRLGYRDARRGRSLRLSGIDATASVARDRSGGWKLAGWATADSAAIRHPALGGREVGGMRLSFDTEARAGQHFSWIELRHGSVRLNDVEMSISGRIDSLKSPIRTMNVEVASDSIPLGDLLASLPEALRRRPAWGVRGGVTLRIEAAGEVGPGRRPRLSGLLTLRRGGAARENGPELARGVEGEATLVGDRLTISRLRGEALGGPLALSGTLRIDSARRFDLRVTARPSVSRLLEVRPSEGVSASGAIDLDLTLSGLLSDPAATRARGRADLQEVRASLPRLLVPVVVPGGRIELTGDTATWTRLAIDLGEDRVVTSGTARGLFAWLRSPAEGPVVTGSLHGRRLLMDEILPVSPSSVGYGRLIFARLGDRPLDGRSAEEIARERKLARPTSLPARGEVALRIDTLRYLLHRLTALSATLRFSPERVEIADATFRPYGGTGGGRLELELGDEVTEPFRLAVRAEKVRAEELLTTLSPLGGIVSGTLTLQLAIDGQLDTLLLPPVTFLRGEGRFAIAEGALTPGPMANALASFLGLPTLERIDFSRCESPFTIRNGAVHLANGRIASPSAAYDITGSVGFGGGLDLGVSARISAGRARTVAPSGGGAGAELLRGMLMGDGPVEVGLRIGGDVWNPEIRLDPGAMRDRAVEAARGELDRRLGGRPPEGERIAEEGQRLLEEKAGGLLRGLLGDTTRAAPQDSGAPANGAGREP